MSQCHDNYDPSVAYGSSVPHGQGTPHNGTQCHDTYPAGGVPALAPEDDQADGPAEAGEEHGPGSAQAVAPRA